MECTSLCAWHILSLYFVSQCIHALSHPYMARFLFRNLCMETCFCSFLIKNLLLVTRCCPQNCGWCVIHARVHWRMASNSQYALPPQSSPQETASGKSQLRSKQSSNELPPGNFVTVGGCFKCYTYRVMALCWLKKERKKMNNFDISGLPL